MHRLVAILFVLVIISGGGIVSGNRIASTKIQPGLFYKQQKRSVIVTFGETQAIKALTYQISQRYAYHPKNQRIHALHQALNSYMKMCQYLAESYLQSNSYAYFGLWSSNTMIINNADLNCVQNLALMKDVTLISEDRETPLISSPVKLLATNNNVTGGFKWGIPWGIKKINVPFAWKYGGFFGEMKQGEGIVVGSIDTGVRATHEALRANFRQTAGWSDGYQRSRTPVDDNGHGTFTIGTIVGRQRIGVAPGAQWIACRGCLSENCTDSALLFCCNWMLCPANPSDKIGPDHYKHCHTAPDLLSNSWGGGQGLDVFNRCIYALQAAGIIPIWAIGNSGPQCGTANSPGDSEHVIGVGATDENDSLAPFSSRGPPVNNPIITKPDISAPGVNILSAFPISDTAYAVGSGTSMATPHVAGVIALMLQRCKLSYKIAKHILLSTTVTEFLGITTEVCGGKPSDRFPNNFYGSGRINALSAVKQATEYCNSYIFAIPKSLRRYSIHGLSSPLQIYH